jgi:hypothetical protein
VADDFRKARPPPAVGQASLESRRTCQARAGDHVCSLLRVGPAGGPGAARGPPMMQNRKTTPRVKDGVVRKKNRTGHTAADGYALGDSLQIIRRAPGPGHVHVVDEHDIRRFLDLVPAWPTLGAGISAIVLDNDQGDFDGCYRHDGVIHLSSWVEEIAYDFNLSYVEAHRGVLARIGVDTEDPIDPDADAADEPSVRCWFDRATARDYMLMHILLHEIGHHLDRSTTRRGGHLRGEDYAESWAIEQEQALWPRYRAVFSRRS